MPTPRNGCQFIIVYLLLLAILTLIQVSFDNLGPGERGYSSKLLLYPDINGLPDTVRMYNACSSPVQSSGKYYEEFQETIPAAYKTLPPPPPSPHRSPCRSGDPRRLKSLANITTKVCQKLFLGEQLTVDEEKWIRQSNSVVKEKDETSELLRKTMSCKWIKEEFLHDFYTSAVEERFPIAYAINMNKVPHQVFHFLKVIYRPHNIYCLHFDQKSSLVTKRIVLNVASCLGNVIVPRKIEDVYWGWYTLEEAYVNCFHDLVLARDRYPWRYVITLCGKELPMRTNAEIVSLLRPLNGTSSIQMVGRDGLDMYKYKWKWSLNKFTGWIMKKDERLDPIPFGLKVYKSWAYVALSFQFVEYYLCSDVGIVLREFMKDVKIPEENIYAMLYMKPDVPGGYKPEHKDDIFSISSYIWLDGDHHGLKRRLYLIYNSDEICDGGNVHYICMVTAKDLQRLAYRPGIIGQQSDSYLYPDRSNVYSGRDRGPLFHNRYYMDWDRVVMNCMEEELSRRNLLEYEQDCTREE